MLLELCPKPSEDFLRFGGELPCFGKRFVKYSDDPSDNVWAFGQRYFGEWSTDTKKPHGRGIYFYENGQIYIGFYNHGERAPGSYIYIYEDSRLRVGTWQKNSDGKKCYKGTEYKTNGTV